MLQDLFAKFILKDLENGIWGIPGGSWDAGRVPGRSWRDLLIAFGDIFLGVAQDRIIEPEFLGVSCVGFERVTAGREKCHVELVQARTFCGGDLQFASAE